MKHFLDIARGAYAHLPAQARSNIAWALRLIPEDLKWGSTYRDWRESLTQTRRNPALIQDRQDRSRLAVVAIAAERSPYYRALFGDVFGTRVTPQQLLDDAHWRQIPILTPAIVMDQAREMCTRPLTELDIGSSGGTSGKPVKFYLDKHRSPIEYAFVHDTWARAGFRAGDPRCVFRSLDLGGSGSERTCMQYDPPLAELRCSVFHLSDETMRSYHDEIVNRGIRFIHGYPSAIMIFAAFLLRAGLAPLSQIRGVFPTSERFNASHSEVVSRAFGHPKIVPFYGLSEKVAFASVPADDLDVFEFEPLYGYTELLDDEDTPVTTVGATGRIVSTGLLFPGMPLLRYDTGDRAELIAPPAAANGYRLTVRGISPKHGIEYLLSRSNLLIAVKGVISNLQGTAYGIREYQFYQDTPGELVVRIVPLPGASNDFTNYRDLLNRKMEGELRATIEIVDAIATTPRGKRKFIDQRLDLSNALGKLAVD
jgi:phenylacetate-CoA ligase